MRAKVPSLTMQGNFIPAGAVHRPPAQRFPRKPCQEDKTKTCSIRLIHWNESEADERTKQLRSAGFKADSRIPAGPEFLKNLREELPSALVIDLSRVPSAGRDIALGVRHQKSTRCIPIVFVGGDPEKTDRIRELLPDAVFTSWERIEADLRRAVENPLPEPVDPGSVFAGYAGKPLAAKLGIKKGMRILLLDAPGDFRHALGSLPADASIIDRKSGPADLILWFVRSGKILKSGISGMARKTGSGSIWILWQKKASGIRTDLSQQVVREAGLANGLVDFKICSVDETWSGLLFRLRKARNR